MSDSDNALRSTATIDGHIWYAAKVENWFKVENIDIVGVKDLKVSIDLRKEGIPKDLVVNFVVKANGNPVLELNEKFNASYTSYVSDVFQVEGDQLTLEFVGNLANVTNSGNGLRLDNILLTGMK